MNILTASLTCGRGGEESSSSLVPYFHILGGMADDKKQAIVDESVISMGPGVG